MKEHKWREFSLEEIILIILFGYVGGALGMLMQLYTWGLI